MSFQVNNSRPPFPPPFGQQVPPLPGSRPGPPPPPGSLPRAPGASPQTTLQPPNAIPAVPNRPSGPRPPFGLTSPPPGAFPSAGHPPPGPRPGPIQSSPMTTGQVVLPSSGAPSLFSNGPPAFGSGAMQGGSGFPAAGSMPRPPVGPPPAPPMLSAPSMHSFLGSPPSGSLPGPAQLAPPFSAPPQGVPSPPSGSSPFSAPPLGMPPPTGSPFGSRTWAMQPQQGMPPPPIPGSVQPPQMFGMPPLLPDQSMAAISPAMSHTGTAVSGPSKIDPNQIPRPIPSSLVVLHETRQGNQANPPPPATSEYIVRDTGNCSPRYMRCTINQIPCTNDLLGTSGMQLALLVQPLALPHPSEEPIQVVDFGESGPVRCSRCKGYINPFMKFIDQGRRFICNLCGFTDDTP